MTAWFLLKILHVFAGAFWFGAALMLVFFIAPSIKATAPAGGAVMGHMVGKLKMPVFISHAAWVSAVSGLLLFVRLSDAFQSGYMETLPGLALVIGGATGLVTFVLAVFVQIPRSKRIAALAAEAGANPTPGQGAEIQAEQKKFTTGGHIVIVLFVITILAMLMSHPI